MSNKLKNKNKKEEEYGVSFDDLKNELMEEYGIDIYDFNIVDLDEEANS